MSTSTNNQDIFRRVLRTKEEAHQLLNLIQKISADMASEKVMNVTEYLGVLQKIFNDVPTFLVFDNVPLPDTEPLPDQGNWYDIGIAMDGSLWWKDLTGWTKIWSPVLTVDLIKGSTEIVADFPVAKEGDVIYTPKGSVYQYAEISEGEYGWKLIHQAYIVELHSVANGDNMPEDFGKDGDIAIDQKLQVFQKQGTWIKKIILPTYTKTEVNNLLNPKTIFTEYDGEDRQVELPEIPKGIFSIHINQTPIFLNRGFTIMENKVNVDYTDMWAGDIITIVYI